jgi:transmembrane sensor
MSEAGELRVTVTGTRFNVSGYEEDAVATIVLEEGEISVTKPQGAGTKQVLLRPGDRLESRPDKDMVLYHNTDVQKYVSWIDGRLIFRDDPLGEILRKLERWYNVEIEVSDPGNRFVDLPFTMTIQHETLPQILEYLRRAAPFSITEEKLAKQDDGSFNRPKYIIKYRN